MTSPMTDSTPLVEKVARAIYAQAPDIRMMNSIQSTLSWDETGEWMREQCRRQARAALDASGNDEQLRVLAYLKTSDAFPLIRAASEWSGRARAEIEDVLNGIERAAIALTQEPNQ